MLHCSDSVVESQIEGIMDSIRRSANLKINFVKPWVEDQPYNSKLDIYSFHNEFLQIYKRTTPKNMMSDVLKNNLLEGTALSWA